IWSDDLANLAQMWINKCFWPSHGFLKFGNAYPLEPTVALRSDQLGQNLAREYGRITDPESRVERWNNEVKYYTYGKYGSPNQCVPGRMCGHYTQLVWALSRNVGCGMRWCNKEFDNGYHPPSNPGESLVSCDYAQRAHVPLGQHRDADQEERGLWGRDQLVFYVQNRVRNAWDCKDHSPSCGQTLTKNMCTSDVEKMKKFCPKMCNLCECPLQCKRGTLDKSRCQCACPSGWRPPDCSECRDGNRQCPLWAVDGECEKNRLWMLKYCKISCNQCKECQDLLESCPVMALNKQCKKSPERMLTKCRRSCGLCKVYDKDIDCPAFSARGDCSEEKHWSWMINNCPLSCEVPLSGVQYCATKPDGYYPSPLSCKGYINCSSGVTKYVSCPEGRAFDKNTKTCRLAEEVMCDEFTSDND
ncbi:hypothetical protein QZH41_020806, partial [Actinostola sp. cb2023]